MNNDNDFERGELGPLLQAVLDDADWQALNGRVKSIALVTMEAATRRRRQRRRVAQAIGATALLAGTAVWWYSTAPQLAPTSVVSVQSISTVAAPSTPTTAKANPFISEAEMLALFPPGSCVVAEVNGQKELVFFDAKKAAEGFVRNGPR